MNRALLATCVAAVTRAADLIRHRSSERTTLEWEVKSHADFVSDIDRSAERAITEIIGGRRSRLTRFQTKFAIKCMATGRNSSSSVWMLNTTRRRLSATLVGPAKSPPASEPLT